MFFIFGWVVERYFEWVREIIAVGHEVGHHGYIYTFFVNFDAAVEEDELVCAFEVLRGFGVEVVGYCSPSWDFSLSMFGLFESHGFAYSSNLMDDIRFYWYVGKWFVELPI